MIRHILFHGLVIFTLLLLAISPLLSAMLAGTIANYYGCDLDEGSIHPCIVNGNDIGDTLYTMGVLGWLALGTIPLGLIAIAIYSVGVALFYLARWLIRRDRAKTTGGVPDPGT
jgi:hypothetical protein